MIYLRVAIEWIPVLFIFIIKNRIENWIENWKVNIPDKKNGVRPEMGSLVDDIAVWKTGRK